MLMHEMANVGNLDNAIILHAQMNTGFYGHSVHGADGWGNAVHSSVGEE